MVDDQGPDQDQQIAEQDPGHPIVHVIEPKPNRIRPRLQHGERFHKFARKAREFVTADWKRLEFKRLFEITGLVVAMAAVYIYAKQLEVMSGQLTEMRGTSGQTDRIISLTTGQLAIAKQNADDTHALATEAKNQADRTKELAQRAEQQAIATIRLGEEAKRAADISKEAQRPWLGITNLELVDGNFRQLTIQFRLRNYGQFPAIFAEPQFKMIRVDNILRPGVFAEHKEVCERGDKDLDESDIRRRPGTALTIFPGPDSTLPFKITRSSPEHPTRSYLLGCIAYREREGKIIHTRVLYGFRGFRGESSREERKIIWNVAELEPLFMETE